ncbi:helix-turn-helix transcriptional regulator [Dyadobacter luticola]|uniref:Helix-turn-helix transcriptional regulator n=1 Tax=Dyadobacter luticola TaxID=1979387 RepID=A0A5R9L625_9BACT|nr:helix-turn-helix transcriptional regulator [Dyadobacter luticola]
MALFNEKGIEYVGMRELAAALDMRIGNLTYYFPTKDDLVLKLLETFSAADVAIHEANKVKSLYDFLLKNALLFDNSLKYKALSLSMVHLIEQNPKIGANNSLVGNAYETRLNEEIALLAKNNYLKFKSSIEQLLLVSTNSLQNRFWMSEALLDGNRKTLEGQKNHYLSMKAFLFTPYATQAGLKDIERFLKKLSNPASQQTA